MKKIYCSILLLVLTFTSSAQSTCSTAASFCNVGANPVVFQNTTNVANSGAHSCLQTVPNPFWFDISGLSGNLQFQISQWSTSNVGLDVDFIIWGPFSSPSCSILDLTPANVVACSYSASFIENFSILNANQSQHYMLLVTNFSNQSGFISITQTNFGQPGAGTAACGCSLTLGDDRVICPNTSTILTASILDATSYQWSSSVSGPISGNAYSITVSEAATYTVVVNKPGCIDNTTASINVFQAENPILNPVPNLIQCSASQNAVFDLTATIPILLQNHNPLDFDVTFHYNELDAQNGFNPIANPTSFAVINSQTIYFNVVDFSDFGGSCVYVGQFDAVVLPPENPIINASTFGQVLTVSVSGNGTYLYQLDGGTPQTSNIFENVSLGNHTINVISNNGCGSASATFEIVIPSAPFALSPQYFNLGDTLQNLITDGQNVQWYADDAFSGIIEPEENTPLPLTTVLEDNTTYYATQTVNGVESENRTAVVTLLSKFSLDDFNFNNLNFFPNPVKNSSTISNDTLMESVEISSILGQQILSQKVNSLQTEINLSKLSNGIYFVKVVCNGSEKTVKIIKE